MTVAALLGGRSGEHSRRATSHFAFHDSIEVKKGHHVEAGEPFSTWLPIGMPVEDFLRRLVAGCRDRALDMLAAFIVRAFVLFVVLVVFGIVLLTRLNGSLAASHARRGRTRSVSTDVRKRGTRDGYDPATTRFLASAARIESEFGEELSPQQTLRRFLRDHGGLAPRDRAEHSYRRAELGDRIVGRTGSARMVSGRTFSLDARSATDSDDEMDGFSAGFVSGGGEKRASREGARW